MTNKLTHQVAIIGAGPYGLSAAAHLRAANVETCVFGESMEFWAKQMPAGMLVRSSWEASHIASPRHALSLDHYSAARNLRLSSPLPLDDFVSYGRWFQEQAVPDLDRRRVTRVESASKGFRVTLGDGDSVRVERVVVAGGIARFARRPSQFDGLPSALVSHSSEHRDIGRFAGRQVVVIGSGQSAVESAVLLSEAGADVEIIARRPGVHWLDQKFTWLKSDANPLRRFFYPPTDVGPPGLNLIVATPGLFRRLPRSIQENIAYRSIRPAASGWLLPRAGRVRITTSRVVASAKPDADRLKLKLDDGSDRSVDHVLLASGYRVDISRYPFLAPELVNSVVTVDGYPTLKAGFETSLPGLHFLGAPAARSFGPVCRFVSGTRYCGPALARRIAGEAAGRRNLMEQVVPTTPTSAAVD